MRVLFRGRGEPSPYVFLLVCIVRAALAVALVHVGVIQGQGGQPLRVLFVL
jgi:hypothetical protein